MPEKRYRLTRILFMPVILLHLVFTGVLIVVGALIVGLWLGIREEWFGEEDDALPKGNSDGSTSLPLKRLTWVGASLLTAAACVLVGSELALQLVPLSMRADDVRIRLVAVDWAGPAAKWPARIGASGDIFRDLLRLAATDSDARIRNSTLGILASDLYTSDRVIQAFRDYVLDPNPIVQANAIDAMLRLGQEADKTDWALLYMADWLTHDGENDLPATAARHLVLRLSEDRIYAMLIDDIECLYRCGLSMITGNCTEEVASAALRAMAFYRLPVEERERLKTARAQPTRSWWSADFHRIDDRPAAIEERLLQAETEGSRGAVEQLRWADAKSADTLAAYRIYLERYPDGRYAQDARTRQAALLCDAAPFALTSQEGTREALERFLQEYPGHRREREARELLRSLDGYDIVDLLDKCMIEVEPAGSGIESVAVKVRRLVPYGVTVKVPVGTFFVSEKPSTQNMVATSECEETLTTDEWTTLSVPAACANHSRDVPGFTDRFTVQHSAHSLDLVRLMPVLDGAQVSYGVRQAAVWIVTDNVNYANLGRLVRRASWMPTGGSPVIRHYEAAQAMKICDEAGIEITQKAIWQDRATIINGLQDTDLKIWLETKQAAY